MTAKDVKITPVGFISYPHLDQPKVNEKGDPRYMVDILFDKDTDLSKLEQEIEKAYLEKFSLKRLPSTFKSPIKDMHFKYEDAMQDLKDFPDDEKIKKNAERCKIYKNRKKVSLQCKAEHKPRFFDMADGVSKEVITPADIKEIFYPGAKCMAQYKVFAYEYKEKDAKSGQKGVSIWFAINAVVARKELGERWISSGADKQEDVFAAMGIDLEDLGGGEEVAKSEEEIAVETMLEG